MNLLPSPSGVAVALGLATAAAAECANFTAHKRRIGAYVGINFPCSSAASCVAEAAAACNSNSTCHSFGISAVWHNASVAQLYPLHWNASWPNDQWTLYACSDDAPPRPPNPPPAKPGECKSDLDCSLNGLCDVASGECACDAPWVNGASGQEVRVFAEDLTCGNSSNWLDGRKKEFPCCHLFLLYAMLLLLWLLRVQACNVLDVLPHPDDYVPAYGGPRSDTAWGPQNVTSWGGNILLGDDGKYHLWVSAMADGGGLNTWVSHSQIDHAVADDPMGVFHKVDTALQHEVQCRDLQSAIVCGLSRLRCPASSALIPFASQNARYRHTTPVHFGPQMVLICCFTLAIATFPREARVFFTMPKPQRARGTLSRHSIAETQHPCDIPTVRNKCRNKTKQPPFLIFFAVSLSPLFVPSFIKAHTSVDATTTASAFSAQRTRSRETG